MDGVTATREMKKLQAHLPEARRVPLVGVTASTDEADEWYDAGVNSILRKPFSKQELCEVIRSSVPFVLRAKTGKTLGRGSFAAD